MLKMKKIMATTAAVAVCASLSIPALAAPEADWGSALAVAPVTAVATAPLPVLGEGEEYYTVKQGDTLGYISDIFYGKSNLYMHIYYRNADAIKTPGMIYIGQVFAIPPKANVLAAAAAAATPAPVTQTPAVTMPVAGEGETLYQIKKGDTLGALAKKYYGASNLYMYIQNRNPEVIKNANKIYAGQYIILPAKTAVPTTTVPTTNPSQGTGDFPGGEGNI